MIRLTERAAYWLREILTANRTPSDQGVKLVPSETSGFGMTIDRPQEGDAVVDGGNRPLLIVDAELVGRCEDAQLDVATETGNGESPRFVLRSAGE